MSLKHHAPYGSAKRIVRVHQSTIQEIINISRAFLPDTRASEQLRQRRRRADGPQCASGPLLGPPAASGWAGPGVTVAAVCSGLAI